MFLIYTLRTTRWAPKETAQHQATVSTIFSVY